MPHDPRWCHTVRMQASFSVPPPSKAASVFTNPARGAAVPMVYYGGNGTQARNQFSNFFQCWFGAWGWSCVIRHVLCYMCYQKRVSRAFFSLDSNNRAESVCIFASGPTSSVLSVLWIAMTTFWHWLPCRLYLGKTRWSVATHHIHQAGNRWHRKKPGWMAEFRHTSSLFSQFFGSIGAVGRCCVVLHYSFVSFARLKNESLSMIELKVQSMKEVSNSYMQTLAATVFGCICLMTFRNRVSNTRLQSTTFFTVH